MKHVSVCRIWEHLVDIARDHNTTIIITTHYIEEARQANMVTCFYNCSCTGNKSFYL
jgi:ABC-type multidrug transport system ATPase subunit